LDVIKILVLLLVQNIAHTQKSSWKEMRTLVYQIWCQFQLTDWWTQNFDEKKLYFRFIHPFIYGEERFKLGLIPRANCQMKLVWTTPISKITVFSAQTVNPIPAWSMREVNIVSFKSKQQTTKQQSLSEPEMEYTAKLTKHNTLYNINKQPVQHTANQQKLKLHQRGGELQTNNIIGCKSKQHPTNILNGYKITRGEIVRLLGSYFIVEK
jgi:hypothetical protein